MFDDDLLTYWHGFEPVTQPNNVVVTFKKPVFFYQLYIVTRPNSQQYSYDAYKSVCLVLDNRINDKKCYNVDGNVDGGKVINLHYSLQTVTRVELVLPNGAAAQIADLKICYNGTLKLLYVWLGLGVDVYIVIKINSTIGRIDELPNYD